MNSCKAGRIINIGNNEWSVEFLPEREEEFKKNEKKRIDAAIEKRIKAIERQKKREEEIWHYEQLKKAEIIRKRKEEEIKRKQEKDDEIRKKIADKFAGAKTLMQYRCAGSKGRALEGTEWGIFIFLRDEKYHRQHESPDKVKIANKPKIVEFKDKKDAIKFCNYLLYKTKNYWYTDTKYLNQADLDLDFLLKNRQMKKKQRQQFKVLFLTAIWNFILRKN